jgi:hypothetical protein
MQQFCHAFILGILLMSILTTCAENKIERQSIPIDLSIRLDSYIDTVAFNNCWQIIASNGYHGIGLEIMVFRDSMTKLPRINRTSLTQLTKLVPILNKTNKPITIMMNHASIPPLFIDSDSINTDLWWQAYHLEIRNELIDRVRGLKNLKRIIIGCNFFPFHRKQLPIHTLVQTLKAELDSPMITYTTTPEELKHFYHWAAMDEIGVYYLPTTSKEERKKIRAAHEEIEYRSVERKKRIQKPVYISHANITMHNKTYQFKNRLRFWHDDTQIAGLQINSVFNRFAPCDTAIWMGWAKDTSALNYLNSYLYTKEKSK